MCMHEFIEENKWKGGGYEAALGEARNNKKRRDKRDEKSAGNGVNGDACNDNDRISAPLSN